MSQDLKYKIDENLPVEAANIFTNLAMMSLNPISRRQKHIWQRLEKPLMHLKWSRSILTLKANPCRLFSNFRGSGRVLWEI